MKSFPVIVWVAILISFAVGAVSGLVATLTADSAMCEGYRPYLPPGRALQ